MRISFVLGGMFAFFGAYMLITEKPLYWWGASILPWTGWVALPFGLLAMSSSAYALMDKARKSSFAKVCWWAIFIGGAMVFSGASMVFTDASFSSWGFLITARAGLLAVPAGLLILAFSIRIPEPAENATYSEAPDPGTPPPPAAGN